MNCPKESLLLYAVTDRAWLNGKTLFEQVEDCLRGGTTMLQLREKELDDALFLKEAHEIKALCARYNVPFIINDNVDIALSCETDGIHVGQSDMQACSVRELIGPDKLLGVSVKSVEQAQRAVAAGADYLGVGAVFPTSTKSDASNVSYDTLKAICAAVSVPVVAIGGITRHNIERLKGSGLAGIAVVSALFAENDINGAAAELRKLSENMVTE